MSIYGIVVCAMESFSLLLLISAFVQPKNSKYIMQTHGLVFALFASAIIILSYFYISIFLKITILSVLAFTLVCVLYDGGMRSKVFPVGLFTAAVISIQAIVGFLVSYAMSSDIPLEDNTVPVIITGLLSAVLLLIFASVVYMVRRKGDALLSRPFIAMSIAVIVSQLLQILLVVLENYDGQKHVLKMDSLNYLVSIGSLVILLSVIGLYAYIRNIQQDRLLAMTERKIYDSQLEHYDDLHEQIQAMSIYRHDMKNLLQLADGLLREREYDKLAALLDNEIQGITAREKRAFTGHSLLDIILWQKKHKGENAGIHMNFAVTSTIPEYMDEIELCMILGNALDNAIEACEKNDSGNRWIDLKMGQVHRMYTINVENPFTGQLHQKRNRFLTTKADAAFHGIGLYSIQSSAEKYGGLMTIDTNDNIFRLLITLPMLVNMTIK